MRLNGNERSSQLTFVRLSDVVPERVQWLWPGYLPAGKLVVLDGDPGLGKSTLTLDLAARITTGERMPDGSAGLGGPRDVVVLSAEDGPADTIRPRLEVAGADLTRVHVIAIDSERFPSFPEDVGETQRKVEEHDAALVIIDPLMALLGGAINSWRDQDIRQALAPLTAMADQTGVTVVMVRHLNKTTGGNPLYRGGGSIGIIGAARVGLLVTLDPACAEGRVLAVSKSNLGPLPDSIRFSVEDVGGDPRIRWGSTTTMTAQQLLDATPYVPSHGELAVAVEFLRSLLAGGPVPAVEGERAARVASLSMATLKRAKAVLGVRSERKSIENGGRGDGGWFWVLPSVSGDESDQEVQPPFHEHLDPLDPPNRGGTVDLQRDDERLERQRDHNSPGGQVFISTWQCPCGTTSVGHVCLNCRQPRPRDGVTEPKSAPSTHGSSRQSTVACEPEAVAHYGTDPLKQHNLPDAPVWEALLSLASKYDSQDSAGLFGTLRGLRCEGATLGVEPDGALQIVPPAVMDQHEFDGYLSPFWRPLTKMLRELAVVVNEQDRQHEDQGAQR